LLTGKRSKERTETLRARTDAFGKSLYDRDDDFEIIKRQLAAKKGLPAAQIALAWMLSKPAITAPIIGASKPGHLEDIARLEEPYLPHPVLGPPKKVTLRSQANKTSLPLLIYIGVRPHNRRATPNSTSS
jgi:aryl-alcohol dehydrogenase-like predicted oxidoreductase